MGKYRYRGIELTGINKLRGKFRGETAVIACSGTSFRGYQDSWAPKAWKRFAVNEAIRELEGADFWVLADDEIVRQYAEFCHRETTILAMRQAVSHVGKKLRKEDAFTVDSMPDPKRRWDNGFQFYSRGTVMIGAVEMARWMGFKRFFVFGLDCYRTRHDDGYYFDGRRPQHFSENRFLDVEIVRPSPPGASQVLYVTARLKKMITKLRDVKASGLWDDIEVWCVNSPFSQQDTVPKMTLDEFLTLVKEETNEEATTGAAAKGEDSTRQDSSGDGDGSGARSTPRKPRSRRKGASGAKDDDGAMSDNTSGRAGEADLCGAGDAQGAGKHLRSGGAGEAAGG